MGPKFSSLIPIPFSRKKSLNLILNAFIGWLGFGEIICSVCASVLKPPVCQIKYALINLCCKTARAVSGAPEIEADPALPLVQ